MAGGGIKVNNITINGGADGKTPIFKIENGYLFNSYDNGENWYNLGKVAGENGINGKDGAIGAKIVSQVLIGQDNNGGNIYKQTFEDGSEAFFVAPKGDAGKVEVELYSNVTVITLNITNENLSNIISFNNSIGITSVDWGDGIIDENVLNYEHMYSSVGKYKCKIYGVTELGSNFGDNFDFPSPVIEVFIGNSVEKIKNSCFFRCEALEKLEISYGVKTIGYGAFSYCKKLEYVNIPDSVEVISEIAFYSNKALKILTVGEKVKNIEQFAFEGCSSLVEVIVKSFTPPNIGGSVFFETNENIKIIVPKESYNEYKESWNEYRNAIDRYSFVSDIEPIDIALTRFAETTLPLIESRIENVETHKADKSEVAKVNQNVADNNREIENIYTILCETVTGTEEVSQAYSVRQTAGGLSIIDGALTRVEKIQGATVKSSNLIPFPYSQTEKTQNGITFTMQEDGGVHIKGTATGNAFISIYSHCKLFSAHMSAAANGTPAVKDGYCMSATAILKSGNAPTIAYENYSAPNNGYIYLLAGNGKDYDCVVYPMLNEGSTALPHRLYFSGLKNAYFEGVKSTSRNLFNETAFSEFSSEVSKEIYNGEECFKLAPKQINHRIPFKAKAGDVITYSVEVYTPNGSGLTFALTDKNNSADTWIQDINVGPQTSLTSRTRTITVAHDCDYLDIRCYSWGIGKTPYYFKSIQLNYGSTALPYEPYKESNLSLNFPIELGKWDYIDFERQKVVRGTKTITFTGNESSSNFGYYDNSVVYAISDKSIAKKICVSNHGKTVKINNYGTAISFYVDTTTITDVSSFKAYLKSQYDSGNPIIVSYPIETPTEESIFIPTNKYTAWDGGSETVNQGTTDNSADGAMPTITQTYVVKRGTTV